MPPWLIPTLTLGCGGVVLAWVATSRREFVAVWRDAWAGVRFCTGSDTGAPDLRDLVEDALAFGGVLALFLAMPSCMLLYFAVARGHTAAWINATIAPAMWSTTGLCILTAFTTAVQLKRVSQREPAWRSVGIMGFLILLAALTTWMAKQLQAVHPPPGLDLRWYEWTVGLWAVLIAYVCKIPWDWAVQHFSKS